MSLEKGWGIEGREQTGWKWERKEKGERKGRGNRRNRRERQRDGRAEKIESKYKGE